MKLGFLAQVPPVSLSLSLRLKFTFGEFSRVDTICKNKCHVHLRSHSWYRKRRAAWIGAMCRVTGRRVRKKTLALMFPKSTDDFEVCRKLGSDFLFTFPKTLLPWRGRESGAAAQTRSKNSSSERVCFLKRPQFYPQEQSVLTSCTFSPNSKSL